MKKTLSQPILVANKISNPGLTKREKKVKSNYEKPKDILVNTYEIGKVTGYSQGLRDLTNLLDLGLFTNEGFDKFLEARSNLEKNYKP